MGFVTLTKIVGIASSILIGLLGFMFVYARQRNVIMHEIDDRQVSDDNEKQLNVFFISDIHHRKIDEKLLEKVRNGLAIDLVIIGGDLAERGVPLSKIDRNVRNLSLLGPIYYVWGNNDREVGEQEIRAILARHGGRILDNENTVIPGHPTWGICGTDDPSSQNVDIAAALRYIDKYERVIVVTHTPSLFRKIEPLYKPRLLLAGHTHGGQIRFGRFGIAEKGAFQDSGDSAKLISNGYGTSSLPLRFGAAPESHFISIRYSETVPKECN
ncbi:metallophosphoesterase [Sporosarcina soli]|uniref:Metallophosphoesterase n=1 Tax=Sporosarcina soli TaxID=334736 RepID=A0ABW0TGJ4_9BACL